ncbi:hypothetical protein [Dyella sp.]|uniref:hypothetical protein n=1 Tax=Dyella sp. TaxID=1869338 RepID=UPI003F81FD9C
MKYHVICKYGRETTYWYNYSREEVVAEILLPFINGHVIDIHDHDGTTLLLNMRGVNEIQIFKTRAKLPDNSEIEEMQKPDFRKNDCTSELLNEARVLQANPQITSLLQKCFATPLNQLFVIMKFGDRALDSAYEGVIKPVATEFGLKALRIDEVQDSGQITDQILQAIATSKYILADLSGERPNCYYEAGFAHALGKPIILTIRSADKVHFDLAGYRFMQWETEADLRSALQARLRSLSG